MKNGGRRTKGAGSVFQDSRGRWRFRREIDPDPVTGRRRYIEATGQTKSAARERFERKLDEYRRTSHLDIPASSHMLVDDYLAQWVDDMKTRVRPRTWYGYNCRIQSVRDSIGRIRLGELTPQHIRRMLAAMSKDSTSQTVLARYQRLSQALDDAEREGLIESNPCRKVKPPRVEAPEVRILGPDDPQRLLDATAMHGQTMNPRSFTSDDDVEMWLLDFEIAFSTGMRNGERWALMPYELEIRDGQPGIHIQQQLMRHNEDMSVPNWYNVERIGDKFWIAPLKTRKSNRFTPISWDLWNRLQARIAKHGIGPRDLIFTNKGRPIYWAIEHRRWTAMLDAAGLPHVKLHSARHWAETRLAEAGVDEGARMEMLGHVNKETNRRYTHWSPGTLGVLMDNAMNGRFAQTSPSPIPDDVPEDAAAVIVIDDDPALEFVTAELID
ncbi:hypothetical protein EP30_01255 [Bifidobacterium sp. UTCIF-39]|uniref:tyrosine-type recombinase/integrase n=1 Tax=Bifidobacterium sp. UTCIF-39 TaxID=1465359 RepID=UPI00112778DD|nr:tyrosine-type recombinase/integrase [Bifidobacterium sp. UTCIF-39]TPF97599.1 hypothetical protein EP30_01255 [Bifidobacterium sp. UTCIF-39]